MQTHAAEPVSESEKSQLLERLTYDGDGRVRVDDTTAFLESATLRSVGLPSPLDHMSRTDRQFQSDLVELRGDEYYRRAIIEAIADGDIRAEPEEILRRIDEKRSAPEDPYRGLYEMRTADVIDSLRDLRE